MPAKRGPSFFAKAKKIVKTSKAMIKQAPDRKAKYMMSKAMKNPRALKKFGKAGALASSALRKTNKIVKAAKMVAPVAKTAGAMVQTLQRGGGSVL